MLESGRPLLVVSDLHLARAKERSGKDLAKLLVAHPEHELVVDGDLFELAMDPPGQEATNSIAQLMQAQPELAQALKEHLLGGSPVTLLAGNHDAPIADPRARPALCEVLGVGSNAPLVTRPWFIRRGDVHIEHGHLYDPDNAPNHPLCLWSYDTEPLGIALTRRFVSPTGATMFAHAYETTPLAGLLSVFRHFGGRAPMVIGAYFQASWGLCVRAHAGQRQAAGERARGTGAMPDLAAESGLHLDMLEEMLARRPAPTHQRFHDTFMRLYFDRIIAGVVMAGSTGAGVALGGASWALTALAGSYLLWSVSRSGSRYSDLPVQRLRDAALRLQDEAKARLVVFGHTHVEDESAGYINTGTFGYARAGGRPYLTIVDGVAERHVLAVG